MRRVEVLLSLRALALLSLYVLHYCSFQNTLPTYIKLALPRQNINPHPISHTN
jgi:hypothetical protein